MGKPWPVSLYNPCQAIPTPHDNCTGFSTGALLPAPYGSSAPSQENSPRAGALARHTGGHGCVGQFLQPTQFLQTHALCCRAIPAASTQEQCIPILLGFLQEHRVTGNAGCHSPLAHCTAPTSLCKVPANPQKPAHIRLLFPCPCPTCRDSSFPAHAGPTSALQCSLQTLQCCSQGCPELLGFHSIPPLILKKH